jgi:hypothetical protein
VQALSSEKSRLEHYLVDKKNCFFTYKNVSNKRNKNCVKKDIKTIGPEIRWRETADNRGRW